MGVTQGPELGVEVQGPLGAVAADAVDAGGDGLVLEQVQLVDEQVVDAGLLEADAVVLRGGGQQAFELGLARATAASSFLTSPRLPLCSRASASWSRTWARWASV